MWSTWSSDVEVCWSSAPSKDGHLKSATSPRSRGGRPEAGDGAATCTWPEDCWREHWWNQSDAWAEADGWEKSMSWTDDGWECDSSDNSWKSTQAALDDTRAAPSAGLRFVVEAGAELQHLRQLHDPVGRHLDTGPMRLRIVGSVESLGCWDGEWDPQRGLDLFWEGTRWTSPPVEVPPGEPVEWHVLRVEQSVNFPGVLQGGRRCEIHESRTFTWSARFRVQLPPPDRAVEVCVPEAVAQQLWRNEAPLPRGVRCPEPQVKEGAVEEFLAFSGVGQQPLPPPGGQRCYAFRGDGSKGPQVPFCLYLPPGFGDPGRAPAGGWPVLLFLHSMHARLHGDMNLFYESDTPLRLLSGDPACPRALREQFVVLSPQQPPDEDRQDGGSIWLRRGWYEESSYDVDMEATLRALLDRAVAAVGGNPDRVCVTGSSMGAYAALELASRWPGYFAACAPVAAHYDLDPIDVLIERLADLQELPLWFFHSRNDAMCPFEPVEGLVSALRRRSKAEVRLTAFTDTWSNWGHCSDRVAYWAVPREAGQTAAGDQLFEWLAGQRRRPRRP